MKKIVICALCLFCVGVTTPAHADNQAEARQAYAKGKEAFKSGNYREALMELSRAYKLDPRPALLRYMGDTHYKMNDARKAIQTYKKYLAAAPEAADREKVQAKVRQLELIVGAGDDDDDFDDGDDADETDPQPVAKPAPREDPPPTRTTSTGTTKNTGRSEATMAPTGEDTEDPLAADRRRKEAERRRKAATKKGDGGGGSALGVAKWVVLGAGVVGLAMGAVFQGLTSSKAGELQDRVKSDCPSGNSSCGGNPNMNTPVVEYSKEHWELEQSFKSNQTIATAMWITGAALTATSVVLFIVDRKGGKERAAADNGRRLVVAPVVGPEGLGVAGRLSF